MKKNMLILLSIALVISAIAAVVYFKQSTNTAGSIHNIEMIAHRGFNNEYPENTIYAAQQAIKLGANPECDVQFTSDGVMVVIHDNTVDRTTDGTGTVSQLNYAYIESLDAGSKFSKEYKGIRIPKFTEYLDAVKDARHIYPELKTYRKTDDIIEFTKTLIEKGFEEKSTIQSFAYPVTLPYIRQVSKKIRVGALCSNQPDFDNDLNTAKSDTNTIMLISTKIATPDNLAKCRESKIDIAVWTIDNISQLKKLEGIGYDKFMCSRNLKP